MEKHEIIEKNQGFYCVVIGYIEMLKPLFVEATIRSLFESVQYGVELKDYSGYILIDSTKIKGENSQDNFIKDIQEKILNQVAMKVPYAISGELATDAVVEMKGYKFEFKISKYERDQGHMFEPVDDLEMIPAEEKIGHFVDLKITLIEEEDN